MKVISEMLRHKSTKITADTYTTVLLEVAREAAEATARLVPRRTTDDGVSTGPQKQNRALSSKEERPGQTWCAARDSNPEPAD